MGCTPEFHSIFRIDSPAVEPRHYTALVLVGPPGRINERVVDLGDHPHRGVTDLAGDQLRVAAADEAGGDVAAARRLLCLAFDPVLGEAPLVPSEDAESSDRHKAEEC